VPHALSEEQGHRLLTLSGLAGAKLDEMEERFAKAFGANPRIGESLEGPLENTLTLGRAALAVLKEEVILPEAVRIEPAEYFDTFTRSINATFRLHEEAAGVLDGLLRLHAEDLRRNMYLIGAGVLATAIILLYLFAGSYLSVMHSLSALIAASRRIGKGDTFVTVSLEARDEMTQVAESFNEMAVSIASFTAELTSTNEALKAEVAERKQAEESLRASEEQYRVIAETSSDGIVTIDDESRIIFVNSALREMFGYTLEEMLGKPLTVLMPERHRKGHLRGLERFLATGKKSMNWKALELPGLHKSGREIPLEISYGTFIMDGNQYFTGFIRDISERKEAEKEKAYKNMLEQFNREIETMVAERTTSLLALRLADSVRTPASVIGWSGKKLLEKGCEYERAKESITDIVEEAGRLDNLVQEFHALIESKRSVFSYIDINDIIREVLFIIEKEARDKSLAFKQYLSGTPLKMNAQRELLRMAVFTLLRNAVESTPEGGTVTLGTEAADNAAVLTVSDTGPGIPDQALEKIFDPSYSAKFFRFGMGLPLIKQIVSEHLGDIEVQSTEGEGTTFRVILPTRWMELSEKPRLP
jgi:PAS domain S-box-containing protein